MLGEGALRPKLEALARKLNISNKVIFKRYVTNPWPYYRNAKVLVSTSDRESFSLVLVESMACGLPVVATSSGGPQEILAAGRFGGLVPVGDEWPSPPPSPERLTTHQQKHRFKDGQQNLALSTRSMPTKRCSAILRNPIPRIDPMEIAITAIAVCGVLR